MADKITVAEAVSLANQDTKDLTNEQLTQMNEAFAESFFNREQFSDEAKMANEVTLAEIDSRLEALNQSQNPYDEKELDSIIAMAESVGMFSQKSNIADSVLKRAQKQKADLEATAQNTTQNTAQNTTQASDEISIGAEDTVKVAEENTDAESNTTSNEDQNQKTENTAEKTEDNQYDIIIENEGQLMNFDCVYAENLYEGSYIEIGCPPNPLYMDIVVKNNYNVTDIYQKYYGRNLLEKICICIYAVVNFIVQFLQLQKAKNNDTINNNNIYLLWKIALYLFTVVLMISVINIVNNLCIGIFAAILFTVYNLCYLIFSISHKKGLRELCLLANPKL